MKALVTGSAGFIGFHLSQALLARGYAVQGFDGMTPYYDVALKQRRHDMLAENPGFQGAVGMLEDAQAVSALVEGFRPDVIVHLAGQAGVRYSLDDPRAFLDSNVTGSFNVIEAARAAGVRHLLMASSSSIYGGNTDLPFHETAAADLQLTFYGATKKAMESMAHAQAHLSDMPTTVFRFFTVYGPWGRPDMALFKFVKAILAGEPIDLYNHGDMRRDFTYVDDLVRAVCLLIDHPPPAPSAREGAAVPGDSLSPVAPYRVVNIGNSKTVRLVDFVEAIEAALGLPAKRNLLPAQPGEVPATWADAALLHGLTGFRPETDVKTGIAQFVAWYRDYYSC